MSDALRKALWFAALWLGGVATLFIVAMIIRAMIF
ncbi:DUF2474 domain-containing protein [Paracoccus salsus]|nr:DUF2474 domain-containing protein [Paracoccus salsus]MCF3973955.1 DUF2474 domain-containing protein [Paracoccus salsus]